MGLRDFLGRVKKRAKNKLQGAATFFRQNPTPASYLAKRSPRVARTVRTAKRFGGALRQSTRQVFGDISSGNFGARAAKDLERVSYFKPSNTGKVRVRDFIRELPMGIDKTAQKTAQDAARFGISAYEVPKTLRTGKASGKYYQTPFGRINSFQSEAQNRVRRGDPLWKAIGNPVAETLLAGTDIGMVAKPLLRAIKGAKTPTIPKEVKHIAGDFLQPLVQNGKVVPFQSNSLKSISNPGLTIKAVNGPTNKNTIAVNKHKAQAKKQAIIKIRAIQKGRKNAYKVYDGQKKQARIAQLPQSVAQETKLPRDVVVKREFFQKMARKHPEINQKKLFEFVNTLHIPDSVYQLPKKERLNFLRKLEDNVKTNIVATVKNSPTDNALTTSFITKSKSYPGNIKKTSKEVFSKDVVEGALKSSSLSPKVTPPAGARPSSRLSGVNNSITNIPQTPPKSKVSNKQILGTPQYNKYQQAAFEKKQERVRDLQNIVKLPKAHGFTKKELDVMTVDDAKKVSQLAKNGYPRKEIDKLFGNRDMLNRAVNNNVTYSEHKEYYKALERLKTDYLHDINLSDKKDIGFFMPGWRDARRNFQQFFGDDFSKVDKRVLRPLDDAKNAMYKEMGVIYKDLQDNVVKKLGIKAGSKASRLVQLFGEQKMSRTQIQKELPGQWRQVIAAEKFFRTRYDRLIDSLNKVIAKEFPTNPYFPETSKIIKKRKDYFHHMQDDSLNIDRILNIFSGPSGIDPRLVGVSEFTKPLNKWNPFAQQRKGEQTVEDAVGNYVNYVRLHGYSKYIDPHIRKFRGIDTELQTQARATGKHMEQYSGLLEELNSNKQLIDAIAKTSDKKTIVAELTRIGGIKREFAQVLADDLSTISNAEKVSNFIQKKLADHPVALKNFHEYTPLIPGQAERFLQFIQDYAGDLAGKTQTVDRAKVKETSRIALHMANGLNSRIKSNTLMGNLGSTLAQFANVPNGVADAGIDASAKAIPKAFQSLFQKNSAIEKSTFIRERYFNQYEKFTPAFLNGEKGLKGLLGKYRSVREKSRNGLAYLLGVLDEAGTRYIWLAEYEKAMTNKLSKEAAVRFADVRTRAMVAGRGIGEVPLKQKSATVKFIAPFQLEVANQWHVFRDWSREPQMARRMMVFMATSWMINEANRQLRGSDVSLDPINAAREAYSSYNNANDKKVGAIKAVGRMVGEGLSNVPFGQQAAYVAPKRIPIPLTSDPNSVNGENKTVAREDLFGDGDPTRFGGGILAVKGLGDPLAKVVLPFGGNQIKKMLGAGKSLQDNYVSNSKGKVQFMSPDLPLRKAQMWMFGKYSTPEAREYFRNSQQPISVKESEMIKSLSRDKQKKLFDSIINRRNADKDARKFKESNGKEGGGDVVSDKLQSILKSKNYTAEIKEAMLDAQGVAGDDRLTLYAKAYGYGSLVSPEPANALDASEWRSERDKSIKALIRNDVMPPEIRSSLLKQQKLTLNDVTLIRIQSLSKNSDKAPHLIDYINSNADNKDDTILDLIDRKILTQNMLKEMYAQELVNSDEYGVIISAIKGSKKRRKTGSSKGRGRGKKGRKNKKMTLKLPQQPKIPKINIKTATTKRRVIRIVPTRANTNKLRQMGNAAARASMASRRKITYKKPTIRIRRVGASIT